MRHEGLLMRHKGLLLRLLKSQIPREVKEKSKKKKKNDEITQVCTNFWVNYFYGNVENCWEWDSGEAKSDDFGLNNLMMLDGNSMPWTTVICQNNCWNKLLWGATLFCRKCSGKCKKMRLVKMLIQLLLVYDSPPLKQW